ncbi:MAG TPA: polysaccharide deacetylase family protein [Solirubrobacteraceae bacterium]|jgi:peptidoglycan/xylan/chitin deacetylase (PgdA/CDA1 family)|nr:polysaccharide deacetylase family protein [Solirubrobacteraceae bacterium]
MRLSSLLPGAAAAALALALGGCGSSTKPGTASTAGQLPVAATPARAPGSGGGAGSTGGSPESAQVRSLVALGLPIYCAGAHGNEVALTFDDGPGVYTRLVINKLRKHRVAATFFDVGRNLELVAHAPADERALGAVGDHTFTHPLLTALSASEAEGEIVRTQSALASASGGPVFLFRPPYGGHSPAIDRIVSEHGMLEILWTVDSADSLGANYAQIESNVIGGLRPGSIILMHENHGQTVRALLSIFAALQRKHLRPVSVPQLLTDDPPSAAQVRAGGSGCGIRGRGLGGG